MKIIKSGQKLPIYYAFKALTSPVEREKSRQKLENRKTGNQGRAATNAAEIFFTDQ